MSYPKLCIGHTCNFFIFFYDTIALSRRQIVLKSLSVQNAVLSRDQIIEPCFSVLTE